VFLLKYRMNEFNKIKLKKLLKNTVYIYNLVLNIWFIKQ